MKIPFLALALSLFSIAAYPEKLDVKLVDHFPEVELKGDYLIKTTREAVKIAEKEFGKAAKRGFNTDEGIKNDGLVVLPFDVLEFSNKGDILFLFEARNWLDSKVLAKAWVNPRNGKCVYFDAPWLSKTPD